MANLNGFDADKEEPMREFEALPADKYLAAIIESKIKPVKGNRGGSYLELTFQVLEGKYKGRNLWARLNLDNKNDQAVKIARSELAAICRAVGVMQPKDSFELHNLPLLISVKCAKREDTGEITNEIKGYANKAEAAKQGEQQPQNAAGSAAPWKR